MMKNLMGILMLSCKKATELIDKKSIGKISVKETVQLQMHTVICEGCKNYKKQSKILDDYLWKHLHTTNENEVLHIINNELKQQIIAKL